jgi:hypothetical protein
VRTYYFRAVELIRREILRQNPEGEAMGVNAVLIDFLLYDIAKEKESEGEWLPSRFMFCTSAGSCLRCLFRLGGCWISLLGVGLHA